MLAILCHVFSPLLSCPEPFLHCLLRDGSQPPKEAELFKAKTLNPKP